MMRSFWTFYTTSWWSLVIAVVLCLFYASYHIHKDPHGKLTSWVAGIIRGALWPVVLLQEAIILIWSFGGAVGKSARLGSILRRLRDLQ